MFKKNWLIFAIAIIILAVAAQVLILKNLLTQAVTLWFFAVMIFSIVILKNQKIIFLKEGITEILAVISVVIAILATIIVKYMATVALLLYFTAAVFLFFSKSKNSGFWEQGQLKNERNGIEKWEPWFVALLLIYTVLLRFLFLNDIPVGIAGQEVTQMSEVGIMAGNMHNYYWHGGGGAEWPSMTMYQALGFANIFGWNIGNFRLASATWGLFYVMVLYFLIRSLFSPAAAAFVSLLFSSHPFEITISREFTPIAIMYASMLLATWLFITAIRKKKWYLFGLSGLILGFTLHGYMPGRILPAVFALWGIYLWIFKRELGIKIKHFAIMLAGFLISAGPIFYFAYKNPGLYWSYFNSVNPNSHGKLLDYIKYYLANIPTYAGAFHVRGDVSPSYTVPCKNLLEPVAATLFPLGLFLALFMLFTPIGIYLIIFFVLSLAPAMLGTGGSGHPGLTRMSGVFSPIYIMIAFAFERIKIIFIGINAKYKKIIFILLAVIAVFIGSFNGVHEYFFQTTNNREFREAQRYGYYLANKELRESKNENAIISTQFVYFFMPKKTYEKALLPEDFLLLDPATDNLLLIEPYLEGIGPYLKDFFPDAKIKVYSEPKENIGKYCYSSVGEPYNPYTYLTKVNIPATDIKDFESLLNVKTGERVSVFDTNFGKTNTGKLVKLKGAFILRKDESKAEIKISWPGWKIISDNVISNGKAVFKTFGVNYFTIEGTVPNTSGAIPIELNFEDGGKNAKNRFFALDEDYGLKMKFYEDAKAPFNKPINYMKNIIFPYYRFFDTYCEGLHVPFMVVLEGYIKVKNDGEVTLKVQQPCYAKVVLDGKIMQNSIIGEQVVNPAPIMMKKGEIRKINIFYTAYGSEIDRTFIMKLPDSIALVIDR